MNIDYRSYTNVIALKKKVQFVFNGACCPNGKLLCIEMYKRIHLHKLHKLCLQRGGKLSMGSQAGEFWKYSELET